MSVDEIRVGSTLWRFDENRRHYKLDERGRSVGGPIWRDHWVEETVVGETSRSWLVGSGWPIKLTKAAFRDGQCPRGWARSEQYIDELAWIHEHKSRIVQRITYGEVSYESLRRIAEIVGYEAPEERNG